VKSMLERIFAPSRLQFRLRNFFEHQSTDSALQGANDEVYLSAVGTDSAAVHIGEDRKPAVDLVQAGRIGDVSADEVRNLWRDNPHVLLDFDLLRPGDWPRTYTCTLLIVEEDNESLAESFDQLHSAVGQTVRAAVVTAVSTATGAAAGAAVGSIIPGIGTAVGAAIGAISAAVYDTAIQEIKEGLGNEVFQPRSLTLTVTDPAMIGPHPDIDHEKKERIEEHGAIYELIYDWHATD
jgi:hypothetical protein